MKAVLNTLTTDLSDNYKTRLEKLKPLMVLFPPLKPRDNDARSAISELSKYVQVCLTTITHLKQNLIYL